MTQKRFSVMAAGGLAHGAVVWEPAALILDTSSSRSETLSFVVRATRGLGSNVAKGETFMERRAGPASLRGYETLRMEMAGGEWYEVATVVAEEILAAAKAMRKSKPKTPTTKTANDEIWTCASCHQKTMSRGGDNVGWKGVQMSPQALAYVYFCSKSPCVAARNTAINVAKTNWGYEDTSAAEVERQPQPADAEAAPGSSKTNYGPLPDKPFV